MKKLLFLIFISFCANVKAQSSLYSFTEGYPIFDTIYESNDTVLYLIDGRAKFIDFIVEEHDAWIRREWEDDDAHQVSYYTDKYFILLSLFHDGDTVVSVGRVTYTSRGDDKYNLEDYSGAIADYTKAIELNQEVNYAYAMRGASKYFIDSYSSAIKDLNKAIELDPEDSYSYYFRGLAKESLGYSNGACSDWEKSAELGDKDAATLVTENCNQNAQQ